MSNEGLLDKWNSLAHHHSNSYIRIDAEHPLDWHIGYEGINQKSLLLISAFEPVAVSSSKSILVAAGQRADKKWAFTLRLIRSEQEDVFIRLCCDLIESSRSQSNTIQGLKFVIHRYSQWSKLMELEQSGMLSESERRGLLGEIHYLQKLISDGMPLLDAVSGWIGPEGADQDFVFANEWYEIKAPGIGAKTVSISSLEQLDAPLPGELNLFFIDKTAPSGVNGFTLNSKVAEVRETLQTSPTVLEMFNKKLLQYGYIDMTEYEKQWYRLGGTRRYQVDGYFPRLIKENVPTQIAAVGYEISIQAIENWRVG